MINSQKNVVVVDWKPLYLASDFGTVRLTDLFAEARVAELVDALDLKSNWHLNASAGSSPASGTLPNPKLLFLNNLGFFGLTLVKQSTYFLPLLVAISLHLCLFISFLKGSNPPFFFFPI